MTKTFLLGVGCQKGGTTWLYDYLMASPQFSHGYRKEYHVFDALDLPSEAAVGTRLHAAAQRAVSSDPGDLGAARAAHRLSMFLHPDFYFDYFTGLLHARPDASLAADMTPAYGMLSSERLDMIRGGFARRGVRTLPVFLMRDPVARIWSQVRMHARLYEKHGAAGRPLDFLAEHYQDAAHARRTRYDLTIRTLDATFGGDETCFAFYEDLFTEATLSRLCDAAGIRFVTPDVDKRVHSSPTTEVLPVSLEREIARHFHEVYAAVAARFPSVSLEELWPSARHL